MDTDRKQIHVNKPVQTKFDSVWFHDQHMFSISSVSEDVCTVTSPEFLSPGDELVQRFFLTDANDVLHAFEEHWKPQWNQLAFVSEANWQRMVGFVTHYLPPGQLHLEPLSLDTWTPTVRTFKRNAARGYDGFSRADLQNMPSAFSSALLHMLNQIETNELAWPQQIAFGAVIGLSKVDQAHEEGQFRPITLFSTVYGAWARLRTKQILRQLVDVLPPEALGFLPRRETTEVWMMLQAQIEFMLQSGQHFAGLSTDLKKAFNDIGRRQVFLLARHMGIPARL